MADIPNPDVTQENSEDLPRKASEEKDVALWHERVSIAKQAQEQWMQDSSVKTFIDGYNGKYGIVFHSRNRELKIPPINEIFAYVQSDIATTYNRDPYISVNAKAGTVKGAALWEVILNYYWRELKNKEELEYEIIDKDLVGFGWHKVGYTANSVGTGEKLKLDSETLFSSYLRWKDVLWNIGAERVPSECSWMAQKIVRPLNWIKKRYPLAKTMEGVKHPDITDDQYGKTSFKDDIKVGVIWEIWDADKKQVLLIAEGVKDKYLEEPKPWPAYIDEFPFLMYWDFVTPGSNRPTSAIAPIMPQILELMILMGQAMNHAKRWNRQLFIKGGTIDDVALDKYERGDDGAVITVNSNLDDASFQFADFGQLPTDFYMLMDRIQAIIRRIGGQPEFAQGGVTKTGTRTVGELNMIEQGTKNRQGRKVDRLETHCENIARHMMAHLKANFDFGSFVKITGEPPEAIMEALKDNIDPATGRVTFTSEEIEGEYDVDVKSGSTLPLNKETKAQIYEIVLQSVAQVASRGAMSPFLFAVIKGILDGYDMKDLEEAFQAEVMQMQKQQQEQAGQQSVEEQKVGAEAMKRQAQAQQITVDTQIQAQEAAIGPLGRAAMERLKKPPPKPAANGAAK